MSSTGALTQLAAKGPQDSYLTFNPDYTLFRSSYKRHSNFAMAEQELESTGGTVAFGNRHQFKLDRTGDLVAQMYWMGGLPILPISGDDGYGVPTPVNYAYWVNSIGHAMLTNVICEIGGHEIVTHTGEYLELHETLFAPPAKQLGEMNGFAENTVDLYYFALRARQMYVPMRFWFNRSYENALPMLALQYHDVKIKVQVDSYANLFTAVGAATVSATVPTLTASLLVNYVYLDTQERRAFAQNSHEYLIEQIQTTGDINVVALTTGNTVTNNHKMTFNQPVSQLIWVSHRTDLTNEPFNYTKSDTAQFDIDPFDTCALFINSHQRFSHDAEYFRLVQPYQHCARFPNKHVYSYSFALYPDRWEPSGSLNFSRIDNAQLRCVETNDVSPAATIAARNVRIYARSFNVLRIVSGMAGLAYSS